MQFPPLAPLPFHREVVDYLRTEEPDVWRWACSAQSREEHATAVRNDLLRHTYRLDADAHPELHECCTKAARQLGLNVPVTLYQAGDGTMNAGLYFMPAEAHVVFFGAVLERFKDAELTALIGHELAHHWFWTLDGGIYHAADRVLVACENDPRVSTSQVRTARLYRLFTEVLADRGAALACQALDPAVATLVKVHTGLNNVSAASYLKQAREVLDQDAGDAAASHPETFQRARALELWCGGDAGAEQWVGRALHGALRTEALDLMGQKRLTALTRELLAQFLRHKCLRSDLMLAHARRFFDDLVPAGTEDASLAGRIAELSGVHDYVCALLMDFATVDRELEDIPLAAAYECARVHGLAQAFDSFSDKYLEYPKRRLTKIRRDAAQILADAERQLG